MTVNLDRLLKKVEKNYETQEQTETTEFTVGGETYEVRKMTRREKQEFIYSLKAKNEMSAGEIAKPMIKIIYNTFGLSQLAVKAKEAGFIKSYYDVVEMLFEPEEILEIVAFLFELNNVSENTIEEAIEETKKL